MRFRCNNPACGKWPAGYEFSDNAGACPKCGASTQKLVRMAPGARPLALVVPLVDVHLMVLHEDGPIMGGMGRQFVACQPKRDRLAYSELPEHHFAASDDPRAVTCPACRRTTEWQVLAKLCEELLPALAEIESGPAAVLMG